MNTVNLQGMTRKLSIRISILTISLLSYVILPAQTLQDRMMNDPKAGASIFRPYSFEPGADVSVPEGYRPFYISHFGRHGSRYYSQPKSWQQAIDCFASAHAQGQLTAEGEALYSAMKTIYNAHDGMYGELAPLGAVEHRQIAGRMYHRERKVFASKKRNKVRCASSVYSRCIMSMANFTEELSSLVPEMEVSYTAGKRYNDEYLNSPLGHDFNGEANRILDSLKRADLDPTALLSLYFRDAEKAAGQVNAPYEVEMGIFYFWAISHDLDFLGVDMTPLIPLDELAKCSAIDNAAKYAKVAVSEEFGKYTGVKGMNLLNDFVVKADDALRQDSDVAADLRFAHDSAFLPMCSLLGIKGYPTCSVEDAYGNWNAADAVPMCANLQMVFYSGRGDVLVKVLVNEKVAVLDDITPVQGSFYRWSDIRSRIEGLKDTYHRTENNSQINQLYE